MVLGLGGTSLIMEHFDPEQSLALIELYKATHSQWVPIMFVRMLKLPEDARTQYDLSSMKCAIHAAAPCPIDVKEAMIDWWGPVIVEYYSGSEATASPLSILQTGSLTRAPSAKPSSASREFWARAARLSLIHI